MRNDAQSSDVAMTQKRVEQLEQEVRRMMTQSKSTTSVAAAQPQPTPSTTSVALPSPVIGEADVQRSLNIQRLEAAVAKQWDAYQKRPRKEFVVRVHKSIGLRVMSRTGA
jgi:protein TonB